MNKAFLAAVVIGQLAVGHAFAGERAATSDGLPRVAVQYGDLNVDSDAGRREAYSFDGDVFEEHSFEASDALREDLGLPKADVATRAAAR